ncbi:MAG: Na/Pi symporter, partial [Planctomycetota bacterium]
MLSLLTIAGGVAFILFGIRFLRKGLDRLFGDRLASVLRRLAGDRWRAAGAGLATSLAAPSSTAMSLLAVQSVRAGDLPARRMIPVLLGADVGITVMVILIALRLEALSPVLILFGVVLFQFMRSRTLRGMGPVLLAIAFILMGVGTISTAARAIEPRVLCRDRQQLAEVAVGLDRAGRGRDRAHAHQDELNREQHLAHAAERPATHELEEQHAKQDQD